MSPQWERTPGKQPELRPYTGQLKALTADDLVFFLQRYELPAEAAQRNIAIDGVSKRYVLPIYGPTNAIRGHVLRMPWDGAPRLPVWCGYSFPKADTYKHALEPLQSHYFSDEYAPAYDLEGTAALVLVEDQLSAIKLAAYGYDSVALLGVPYFKGSSDSYAGVDRVREIARRAKDGPVIVALDSDMTETALLFAKRWRPMFNSIRVAILDRDLKDTRASEFADVLGV